MEKLELIMCSLVMYQLSGHQACIQAQHASDEYANKFNDPEDYLHWRRYNKTVLVKNGGSSSKFTNAVQLLEQNGVPHATFNETDLYNMPFAVAFLIDERVWDTEKYPDMPEYYNFLKATKFVIGEKERYTRLGEFEKAAAYKDEEVKLKKDNEKIFAQWIDIMGTPQNVFLREFIKKYPLHK